MAQLTGRHRKSSEKHVEMGTTRCRRDMADMLKIKEWINQHEQFDENSSLLQWKFVAPRLCGTFIAYYTIGESETQIALVSENTTGKSKFAEEIDR